VTDRDRYDASERVEGQFEPGSKGLVAKNRLGIVSAEEIERVEAAALVRVTEEAVQSFDAEHRFTVVDVRALHRSWLGEIYEWAGEYRQVNVGKGGFLFAAADRIPALMEEFEAGPLRRNTPCKSNEILKIASALAETHVELVLIHPFRDGNGRVARLLSVLMALQAGLPFLDFAVITDARKAEYFASVQAGMNRHYAPMSALFVAIIQMTIERVSE
jgi:cell filamentation protein